MTAHTPSAEQAAAASPKHRRRRTRKANGPHPVDLHVGQRMRLRRLTAGIGQQELGDAIGVTFQAIQKYESGENRAAASRLHEIAAALGVAAGYFFEGAPGGDQIAPFDELADRETMDLVRDFRRIQSRKMRDVTRALVRQIAEAAEIAGTEG